jgi:hypothetical protein
VLDHGFDSSLAPSVNNIQPWVIDALYYPATTTGYWFCGLDAFSSYGLMAKVSERRAMGLTADSLTEQEQVTAAGLMTRERLYNYPTGRGG